MVGLYLPHHRPHGIRVGDVCDHDLSAMGAYSIEFIDDPLGIVAGAAGARMIQHDIGPGSMKGACDLRADALRRTRDECDFASKIDTKAHKIVDFA